MYKLLNRFAWFISITLGLALAIYIDNDFFIGGIILGFIFKKLFLSENFIIERLEYFANGLEKRISLSKLNNQNMIKDEIIQKEENHIISKLLKSEKDTLASNVENTNKNYEIDKDNFDSDHEKKEGVYTEKQTKEPSKIILYIKEFFSENILAKIGSILVFLAVMFLMSVIWIAIPSTGKIILGFIIGFTLYFSGVVLDKKGYSGESRILLGTGILVNFLVILGGKYVIGDNYSDGNTMVTGILSTGITFLFLVLNTIFGVLTSLIYKSRSLLLFSFIFAYINPFLTGGSAENPYTLVGYSLIVSLGALFLGAKQKDSILTYSAFILGNLLILVAPYGNEIGWITKLIASGILGLLSIFTAYTAKNINIGKIAIFNYIFIILLLIGGDNIISQTSSFISYMISILGFFALGIWLFIKGKISSSLSFILFPLLIILGLIFTGSIGFISFSLGIVVLSYILGFSFIGESLSPTLKYVFFGLLGGFIFMVNSYLSISAIELNNMSFLTVIIIAFIFLSTSYYLSRKKNLEFLYTIGTLGTILTLLPIIHNGSGGGFQEIVSIIGVIVFSIFHWILPFISTNLIKKGGDVKNLVLGSVIGILFIGFQLYSYGIYYFPGVSLGLSFLALAITYFILSYIMMSKIGIDNIKSDISSKNSIFSYLFISISLFSLAISFVFSSSPEIISAVWLFEATILFYFYNKTQETKIFTVGIILFIIGLIKLTEMSIYNETLSFIIPLLIILSSFIYNIKFLERIKNGPKRIIHDILHILGMLIVLPAIIDVLPSFEYGIDNIWIGVIIIALSRIYSSITLSKILKFFFVVIFTIGLIEHYDSLSRIFREIKSDSVNYLQVIQYIIYGIIGFSVYIFTKLNTVKNINKYVYGVFSVYSLFILSYFVYNIFENTFAITIFWGIISSIPLFYGIQSDTIRLRTLGLYILGGVLTKIFLYDLWYGLDDPFTRVFALLIIGILMIIISTRYTKKYGNNLSGELSLKNLSDNTEKSDSSKIKITSEKEATNSKHIEKTNKEKKNIPIINKSINDIDITNIDSVQFIPNKDKSFSSKAKNVKKIATLILKENKQGEFGAHELSETYNYIINNYESDLSKRDFDLINGAIRNFVEKGGKIKIK